MRIFSTLLSLAVLTSGSAAMAFGGTHSITVECSSSDMQNRTELSGTMVLRQEKDLSYKVTSSSFIYLLKPGTNTELNIESASINTTSENAVVKLTFKEDLQAELNIASNYNIQSSLSQLSAKNGDSASLQCHASAITKRGFHLKSILEMPFAD